MTFLPLVQRELLATARRKGPFRVRFWSTVIALIATFFSLLAVWVTPAWSNAGAPLFSILTHYVFAICLLSGPFLAANSLSEEKREGTLGLLFLTDLKGYDVVLGKFVAGFLAGFYGLLALLPVLAIPLLLGGVTNGEFWRMALSLGVALLVSLATGILVATLTKGWNRTTGNTIALILLLTGVLPALSLLPMQRTLSPIVSGLAWLSPWSAFSLARELRYVTAPAAFWSSLGCSTLLACLFLAVSSRFLPTSWQSESDTDSSLTKRNRSHLGNVFGRPAGKRLKAALEINPVLYLMGKLSGTRRLAWWIVTGWGIILCSGCIVSGGNVFWVYTAASLCGLLLKILVAGQACRFFAESRQNGSLELLLSTPIRDGDIIKGQWLALRRIFLWPFLVFLLITYLVPAVVALTSSHSEIIPYLVGLAAGFMAFAWFTLGFVADIIAVAWFGMWLALTMRRPQLATAATVLFVVLLPSIAFCASRVADIFFILWGAIKLHQDLRWTVATQYQRAIPNPANTPNIPPVIVSHPGAS